MARGTHEPLWSLFGNGVLGPQGTSRKLRRGGPLTIRRPREGRKRALQIPHGALLGGRSQGNESAPVYPLGCIAFDAPCPCPRPSRGDARCARTYYSGWCRRDAGGEAGGGVRGKGGGGGRIAAATTTAATTTTTTSTKGIIHQELRGPLAFGVSLRPLGATLELPGAIPGASRAFLALS